MNRNKKALVVTHRSDLDGKFSGLIILKALSESGIESEYIEWNYGDELPNFEEIYNNFTDLIMADISFPPETMLLLKNKFTGDHSLTLIDHHFTLIEDSLKYGFNDIPGIRRNGTAACELCWEYFYPSHPTPRVIEYLGCYDVWNKTRHSWDHEVLPFQYGLKTRYGLNMQVLLPIFNDLLYEIIDLDEIIHEGEIILKYLERTWKSACKMYSFEVRVDNKYHGICLLTTEFTSNVFNSISKDYDVVICCNRKSPDIFNIGMYKDPDKCPEFNCGDYLREKYNGGGHKCSSGCTLNLEQFRTLVEDCEI